MAYIETVSPDDADSELGDEYNKAIRRPGRIWNTNALLEYAEILTQAPAAVRSTHVDCLREASWSGRAIHDAAQVVSYFNCINRVADGLGVHPEEWIPG